MIKNSKGLDAIAGPGVTTYEYQGWRIRIRSEWVFAVSHLCVPARLIPAAERPPLKDVRYTDMEAPTASYNGTNVVSRYHAVPSCIVHGGHSRCCGHKAACGECDTPCPEPVWEHLMQAKKLLTIS